MDDKKQYRYSDYTSANFTAKLNTMSNAISNDTNVVGVGDCVELMRGVLEGFTFNDYRSVMEYFNDGVMCVIVNDDLDIVLAVSAYQSVYPYPTVPDVLLNHPDESVAGKAQEINNRYRNISPTDPRLHVPNAVLTGADITQLVSNINKFTKERGGRCGVTDEAELLISVPTTGDNGIKGVVSWHRGFKQTFQ